MDDLEMLDEKLETLQVENELLEQQVELEKRKAIIKELKAKYGKDWKNIFTSLYDNETIKQLAKTSFRLV